jgi:hypothetical protein
VPSLRALFLVIMGGVDRFERFCEDQENVIA